VYDSGRRRKATRAARQKGCFVYIPAEVLEGAGVDPKGPTPWYRTWAGKGGSVMLRLYDRP
jgi:hypothetical protein